MNILKEFKNYVYKFDINDENIMRKYYHSLRVMDLAKKIAIANNLSEEDIEVAMIIGLLHDYARFEQWKNYNTYKDSKSFDHGDMSVKILFEDNEINKYYNVKENYGKIYNAIKYHNKLLIPDFLNDEEILMCKIIRDADKLDIFTLIINGKIDFYGDDSIITKEVEEDFFKRETIDRKKIRNQSDIILLRLAMIYDINFEFSYNYIKDNRIIDKLLDKLENKEKYKKYFEYVRGFMK